MSANMDKGLYQAPVGLDSLDEEPIDIILTDGEEEDTPADEEEDSKFDENLAETLPESVLGSLASDLLADYDTDLQSRKEWLETYMNGLKLVGLKYETMTEPWPGACGVSHPLLMESAVKFQSETIMETFPASGPVRTKIIGKETPEKKEAAQRVEEDMNYELTERMIEYRPEHERMLMTLCLSGNAFKKVYFDPSLDRQTAAFIPAEDIVVPYGAANIETAERVTHRMRKTENELRKLQVAGFYRDVPLGEPMQILDEMDKYKGKEQGVSAVTDNRFQLLEMHVELDLEGYEDKDDKGKTTGIKLPYVVTIEKGTKEVLAVRRNWLEDDNLKQRRQHFVHYGYIPGFGFYYFGLIHLIGGHTRAATSLLRQLIDAGTLSNLPGGLKTRGMRIKGDDTPISPGEFRDVDVPSGVIKDNILPLPYKEPSQTLAALMDRVVEDGRRFAATADLKISDMSSQAPVGTTLAVLERALKVMSAVQARIHYAMKQEFKLLAAIIRDNTPEEYDYEPDTGEAGAKKSDYDMVDVLPVSDPNASTMSQRVVQYQAVMQLSQTAPQIYDLPFLHRQMIETLGVKNAAKIIPEDEDMKPIDPVSENMNILMQKPVKAFQYQDHEAHLAVHLSAMQDPKIAAVVGQNPMAQMILAAGAAHVMEHIAFQYRKDIEKQLGAVLPPMPTDDGDYLLPPEIEVQVSQLAAAASAKLLQKDQAEMAAMQQAQAAQDPLMQLQMKDLQIKELLAQVKQQKEQFDAQIKTREQARKERKDLMDAAAKADQLELQKQDSQERNQIAGAQIGVDVQKHRDSQELEGARLGAEIGKQRFTAQQDHGKTGVEAAKHVAGLKHEMTQAELDRQHEKDLKEQDLAHQSVMAARDRAHQAEQAKQKPKKEPKK